jgi:hypothetical protein
MRTLINTRATHTYIRRLRALEQNYQQWFNQPSVASLKVQSYSSFQHKLATNSALRFASQYSRNFSGWWDNIVIIPLKTIQGLPKHPSASTLSFPHFATEQLIKSTLTLMHLHISLSNYRLIPHIALSYCYLLH